jgi:hypothetical protein
VEHEKEDARLHKAYRPVESLAFYLKVIGRKEFP